MDINYIILEIALIILDFEEDHDVIISKKIKMKIYRTILFKWNEIERYYRKEIINEQYIIESLKILLKRTLKIYKKYKLEEQYDSTLLKSSMFNESLMIKKCDHYPFCDAPLNR